MLATKWGTRKQTYFTFIEGQHNVGKCRIILSNPKYYIVLHFFLRWNIPCNTTKAVFVCGTRTFHGKTITQKCWHITLYWQIYMARVSTRLRIIIFICSTWWWAHNWTQNVCILDFRIARIWFTWLFKSSSKVIQCICIL